MRNRTIVDLSVEGLLLQNKKDKGSGGQTAFSVKIVFGDGHVTVIHRRYGQFIKLQEHLLQVLKKDGRQEQGRTLLPKLQGSRFLPKDEFKKMDKVNSFLKKLVTLPEEILLLDLITDFFTSDDASTEEPKEGMKKLQTANTTAQTKICVEQEARPSPKAKLLDETCYKDTSWKPQDLHLLSDKTLSKLHKTLSNSESNLPISTSHTITSMMAIHERQGAISRPFHTTQSLKRRGASLGCTLSHLDDTLGIRKNQHRMASLRKRFHSEMHLNATPGVAEDRHNPGEISDMQESLQNVLEYRSSSLQKGRRRLPATPSLSFDESISSAASGRKMAFYKAGQGLAPKVHNRKKQLPSTPSRPSKVLSSLACTQSQRPQLYPAGRMRLNRISIKALDTNGKLRKDQSPLLRSCSAPEEPVVMAQEQELLEHSRFLSWPHNAHGDEIHGCLSVERSPSPLSCTSSCSLDGTLYAESEASESDSSPADEDLPQVFDQVPSNGSRYETRIWQRDFVRKTYSGTVFRSNKSHSISRRSELMRDCQSYEVYTANYCYHADGDGELSLLEGDEVIVIEKWACGWWFVVKANRQKGWAPSNFLSYVGCFTNQSLGGPRSFPRPYLDLHREESFLEVDTVDRQDPGSTKGSLDRHKPEGYQRRNSAASTTEITMNRSIKFLTVEGIQKRKDPEKNYVYVLKVVWSDGTINIIYRKCSDFFRLQENLKADFPDAVGDQIPVLKGRKFYENCRFCFKDGSCKRRNFLNQFCYELINTQVRISRSDVVLNFCKPTNEDLNPQVTKKDKKATKKETGSIKGGHVISSPVAFEQYIAVADYKKQCKNDISLDAGDIVDVIEKNEYGWWLVDRDGELGWAPASYLEPTDDGSEDTITTQTFGPGEEEIYMSIKEHKAKAADELSFDIGVMLQVIEKTLDGWWLVRYHGRQGWAPAMVLKKVDNNSDGKRKISSTTGLRSDNEVDIPSFNGKKEAVGSKKEFMERNPPTRRSRVRRTIKKKPKSKMNGADPMMAEGIDEENLQPEPIPRSASASATYHSDHDSNREPSKSRSDSTPPSYSPVPSPRMRRKSPSPQAPPRTLSKNMSLSEIDKLFRTHHPSASSSGYDSSPGGSMNSLLVIEAMDEGGMSGGGQVKSFDSMSECLKGNLQVVPNMRRSRSSSGLLMMYAMEQEREQRERAATLSANMGHYMTTSLPRAGVRERSSTVQSLPLVKPIPAPRKISLVKSPLASPPLGSRSHSPKEMEGNNGSLERRRQRNEVRSVSDYEDDDSDSSSEIISTRKQRAPQKELAQSANYQDEQSVLRDDSGKGSGKIYSPTDDSVFNQDMQLEEEDKENQHQNKTPQRNSSPHAQHNDSRKYRATFCYDGEEEEGEIRFSEGDIVEVIQQNENGWWLVRTHEGIGWGPSTYLESLEA